MPDFPADLRDEVPTCDDRPGVLFRLGVQLSILRLIVQIT